MGDEATNRAALLWQAGYCAKNGAPVTGRICAALAEVLDSDSETGRRAIGWAGDPIADALPLRLAAPFHALHRARRCDALGPVYRGEIADARAAVRAAIAAHDGYIAGWLDGPPQTNEPARSGVFMAGLLVLARRFGPRFELLEIGSSAGLNLLIDRYHYRLGGVMAGPADAAVRIEPEWRGAPPPDAPVAIESVRGVDIAPLDIAAPGQADRLLAYVWADQTERFARMEKALALARARPPRLDAGDAAHWIEARLAEPQPAGVTRVLMHSIVWQYLPPEGQARIAAAMAAAGARATAERPLGWIAYEAQRSLMQHSLTVRSWPGSEAERTFAICHPHGAWIEWTG